MISWQNCVDRTIVKVALQDLHARPTKAHEKTLGTYEKSPPDMDILARHPQGCYNANKSMYRRPHLLSNIGSSRGTINEHYKSIASLLMGNRHYRTVPESPRKVKFLVVR